MNYGSNHNTNFFFLISLRLITFIRLRVRLEILLSQCLSKFTLKILDFIAR